MNKSCPTSISNFTRIPDILPTTKKSVIPVVDCSLYVQTDPDCFLVSSICKYDCAEELDFSLYEIPRFSLDILPDMKFTTSHGAKALF